MADARSLGLAARRTTTFATAAALADTDAFKAATPTATTAAVYATTDLDGALANPGPVEEAAMLVPRYPSVTSSTSAATYNTTDPIIFTGTRGGQVATVSLTLTQAGGNETVIAAATDEPLDTLTSISVPAQLQEGGTIAFGFSGIGCRRTAVGSGASVERRMAFKALADGYVECGYSDGITDVLPVKDGVLESVTPKRIYGPSNTTVGVTVYD